MGTLDFCGPDPSLVQMLVAFSITYTPLGIYMLKITGGAIYGILNIFIFVNCAGSFAYLMYQHNGSSNTLAFSLGAIVCALWGIYAIYNSITWLATRCRLCRLGRGYILAPPNHVETSEGLQRLTTSLNTAFVVRKPGETLVNGQLVPGFKRLVLGGRKAISKGAVSLLKYAK